MFTRKYYVTVASILIGTCTQFYHFGITNGLYLQINQWTKECFSSRNMWTIPNSLFWSGVVSLFVLGAIPGLLVADFLATNVGPCKALILNGILNISAQILQLLAIYISFPELMLVSRLILGFSMTLGYGLMTSLLADITPIKIRPQLDKIAQTLSIFSLILSYFAGLPELNHGVWSLALVIPLLTTLIMCLILSKCSESPKFLYMSCGQREKAQEVLNEFFDKKQATAMFVSLIKENSQTREQQTNLPKLFSRRLDFQCTIYIALLIMLAQSFTGISIVFSFSNQLLLNGQNSEMNLTKSQHTQLGTAGIGLAYFTGTILSKSFVNLLGQKPAILFQFIIVSISLLVFSIAMWIHEHKKIDHNFGAIFALLFYAFAYGLGSPTPWLIGPKSIAFNCPIVSKFLSTFNWIVIFVLTCTYLPLQLIVPKFLILIPFFIISALFAVLFYFIVPETWTSHAQPWHKRRDVTTTTQL